MPMTKLQEEVFRLCDTIERGGGDKKERLHFFSMVRDLCVEPLRKDARRKSGLAKFDRETRRCVYPNGVHPKLAYLTEGEPEFEERKVLLSKAESIYQKNRMEFCGE